MIFLELRSSQVAAVAAQYHPHVYSWSFFSHSLIGNSDPCRMRYIWKLHEYPCKLCLWCYPLGPQCKQLKKSDPQVVIATPGRLCDLLNQNVLSLSNYPFAILDKADQMLDTGFEKQLTTVMNVLPAERRTLFFTDTWPKSVCRVADKFLLKGENNQNFHWGCRGWRARCKQEAVTQTFVEAQDDEKDKKLYDLLCGLEDKESIVILSIQSNKSTLWPRDFGIKALLLLQYMGITHNLSGMHRSRNSSIKRAISCVPLMLRHVGLTSRKSHA